MKIFIMAIGLPGSGKSTAIHKLKAINQDVIILSTDDYIQAIADSTGKTYDETLPLEIKNAESNLSATLEHCLKTEYPFIIWDQTNVSKATRIKRLNRIPDDYLKIAWYFERPDDSEWYRRLDNRPGKTIPYHILKSMENNLVVPDIDEGFDYVVDKSNDIVLSLLDKIVEEERNTKE